MKRRFMRWSRASGSTKAKIERIYREQCQRRPVLRGPRGAIAAYDPKAQAEYERASGLDLI